MHLWRPVARTLRPLVIGSQAVPIVVLAPLICSCSGFGLAPKVLIVALVCFFPVTINLFDGLRDADPDARKLLRSLDASRWQTLRTSRRRRRCPPRSPARGRRRGGGDRRRVRGVGGLGRRPRPPAGQRQRPARARRAPFAATLLLFALAVLLYGAFARSSGASSSWTPRAAR